MALTKKQLEAVSITAQNDAIALSEIYRACFNEVADNIIETVAVAYAKSVAKPQIKSIQVKLLKPSREEEYQGYNVQELLPMRKPRYKAS